VFRDDYLRTETTEEPPDFVGQGAGKEFERYTFERLMKEEEKGKGCWGRYGVQCAVMGRNPDGTVLARVIPSLPDFEGVIGPMGRQVVWDCKVSSQSSMDFAPYRMETRGSRSRQLNHLLSRSTSGALCGFLIHWNSRETSRSKLPAETFWLPVHSSMRLWKDFDSGVVKRIDRGICEDHGHRVPWNRRGQERKSRPDVLAVWRQSVVS
jgi:hypothetical protein